jgi:hypothetical protein
MAARPKGSSAPVPLKAALWCPKHGFRCKCPGRIPEDQVGKSKEAS